MEARSKAVQATGGGHELSQLKRRFDQWRAGRKVGQRIAQDLWAGPFIAATEHGACRVSAELHLDYNVFKRRAALAGGKAPGTELTPRFVELFATSPVLTGARRGHSMSTRGRDLPRQPVRGVPDRPASPTTAQGPRRPATPNHPPGNGEPNQRGREF
jgi:hypothetical protein